MTEDAYVTRDELRASLAEFRADWAEQRTDWAEMRTEWAEFRREVRADLDQVRGTMRGMQTHLTLHTWIIGLQWATMLAGFAFVLSRLP